VHWDGYLSTRIREFAALLRSALWLRSRCHRWFLRRWKRLLTFMIVHDALLVSPILLLENQYLVDLIAAVPVAVLAIAINGRNTPGRELECV
jgi:hypothetical protein